MVLCYKEIKISMIGSHIPTLLHLFTQECSEWQKKEAESSNSEKKQCVAWLRHACLLKVLRTDLSVLETPSHAVPRLLDTIHSLWKNRWKVL